VPVKDLELEKIIKLNEDKEAYINFIEALKSDATKRLYRNTLFQFLRYCNIVDCDQFIKLPIPEIEIFIKRYLIHLQKTVRSTTRKMMYEVVKKFLYMNDVEPKWRKLKQYLGKDDKKLPDKPYTHELIQQLLSLCDTRLRAVVLMFSSTGLRLEALAELKMKHLEKVDSLYKIVAYNDEKEEYITFCTPECASAIDSYIEYRKREGETIGPDSFLIRDEFDYMEAGLKRNVGPVCVSNIQKLIARRLVKLGIRDVNHDPDSNRSRKDVKVCHGFRKFFTNQCINSELLTERRWLLEGHNLKANDNNYVRQNQSQLLTEYMKAVDNLTIDPTQRMARQIQSLQSEKSQFDRLAAQIKALEAKIK
jgi:integrase